MACGQSELEEVRHKMAWLRTFAQLVAFSNPYRKKGRRPINPLAFYPWREELKPQRRQIRDDPALVELCNQRTRLR